MRKRSLSCLYALGFAELTVSGVLQALPLEGDKGRGVKQSLGALFAAEPQKAVMLALSHCKNLWPLIACVGVFTVGAAILMTIFKLRRPVPNVPKG